MNFQEAIQVCFQKYFDFNGRAKKPEFWWFFLFCFLVAVMLGMVSNSISTLFSLATLFPALAVGSRRLHDTNKSGWFQLIWLIPLIGWLVMIYLMIQDGDADANQYGEVPTN